MVNYDLYPECEKLLPPVQDLRRTSMYDLNPSLLQCKDLLSYLIIYCNFMMACQVVWVKSYSQRAVAPSTPGRLTLPSPSYGALGDGCSILYENYTTKCTRFHFWVDKECSKLDPLNFNATFIIYVAYNVGILTFTLLSGAVTIICLWIIDFICFLILPTVFHVRVAPVSTLLPYLRIRSLRLSSGSSVNLKMKKCIRVQQNWIGHRINTAQLWHLLPRTE